MRRRVLGAPGVLAATAFAVGCRDLVSEDIKTEDLRAIIEARAWDDGAAAIGVEFKVHRPWRRWIQLTEGDVAEVRRGEDDWAEMNEETFRRRHSYVAWYSDVRPEEAFEVRLRRPNGDVLDGSFVSVPPAYNLEVSPTFARMGFDDVTLTWSPVADDTIEIGMRGSCIWNKGWTLAPGEDTGSLVIRGNDLRPVDSENPTSCSVVIDVQRWREGEASGGFKKAEARGVQLRTVAINVTPR